MAPFCGLLENFLIAQISFVYPSSLFGSFSNVLKDFLAKYCDKILIFDNR